jgi:ATP-dependent RNA helicase DDX54/DBP10
LNLLQVVRELGKGSNLRTAVLVGGDAMEAQFAELAASPDVIVATPGRLLHHLAEVAGFGLDSVEFCVFDEADRMFEMGFAEQVGKQTVFVCPWDAADVQSLTVGCWVRGLRCCGL